MWPQHREVEQLVARQAHNLKAVSSSLTLATNFKNVFMETIKAKFHCDINATVQPQWHSEKPVEKVELTVVNAQAPEDQIFSASTPGGEIKLTIANVNAHGFFKPGKKYYVTFEEAI